jgi:hypothetical protein
MCNNDTHKQNVHLILHNEVYKEHTTRILPKTMP